MKWIYLRHRSRMINLNSLKAIYSKGSTVVATDFDDVDMSLLECTNENMAHNLVGIIANHFAHYDVLTIGLEGSKIDVSPTPRQ